MNKKQKILIAYYSQKNHTKKAAENLQKLTGGDLFSIEMQHPYPEAHDPCLSLQIQQLQQEARPELTKKVPHMEQYDIVFIGYPIWYYVEPLVIDSFLEAYDFSGKTVIPFCTSGGSSITESVQRVRKCVPQAKVLPGFCANSPAVSKDFIKKYLFS